MYQVSFRPLLHAPREISRAPAGREMPKKVLFLPPSKHDFCENGLMRARIGPWAHGDGFYTHYMPRGQACATEGAAKSQDPLC